MSTNYYGILSTTIPIFLSYSVPRMEVIEETVIMKYNISLYL